MDRLQKNLISLDNVSVNEKTTNDDVGGGDDDMDIISNLPIEIVGHILSFLPLKNAVATIILSTKWKNFFPLIPNLRLCLHDELPLCPEAVVNFRNFVNRLFNVTLRDVRSIYSLCLTCLRFSNGKHIAEWVSAALNRNVRKMDIKIYHINNSRILLDSLFGCKITSLNLLVGFNDETLEGRFSLPNLKKLSVQHMNFLEVKSILDGCPLVENLVMHHCFGFIGTNIRLYIPSLKVLKFVNNFHNFEPAIELDCPNLEIINFSGTLGDRYMREKLKSLRIAHFDIVRRYAFEAHDQAAMLIFFCSDVEKLILSEKFITALHRWSRPMPHFQNLVTLAIRSMNSDAWELLPNFLGCAPNLKILIIERGFDIECFKNMKASLKEAWSFCLCPQRDERCMILKIEREADKDNSF